MAPNTSTGYDSPREPARDLIVEDLRVAYLGHEILRGLTLRVSPGEVVAVLGLNGSGKSTLLKAIAGIVPSVSGRVFLGETEISRFSIENRVRAGVGLLLQRAEVFSTLTVRENLDLAANAGAFGRDAIEIPGEIVRILEPLAGKRAGLLSQGQRRMLSFAMVLRLRPSVLLLDEPSAGLAPDLVLAFIRDIATTARNHLLVTLLVEQNARVALTCSDRSVVLREGRAFPLPAGSASDTIALALSPHAALAGKR